MTIVKRKDKEVRFLTSVEEVKAFLIELENQAKTLHP